MAVEMLSYIDRRSSVHELTGATKLICFILWSFAVMLTYDTRILLGLFAVSLFIFYFSKIKIGEVGFVLGFIAVFLLLNNIAIYIFSPQEGVKIYGTAHVLIDLYGRYNVTIEQLFYQGNITLKYFIVIPIALLFIVTTHPSEFASSLNKIGVSYRIAFSVAIALRYIPDIQRDYYNIALSQQARGLDMSKKEKLSKRLKNASSIILPLILSSLDRIEEISNVMELRGFGKNKKRTWFSARDFKKRDYIALTFIALLFILSMVVTFVDGNRFYNPFV
ncbi:energy-coupling factor transporter transmembrane component T family protein [Priestia koreensis]|uniref:energy-coupling factor transporter transmembrane component T family protein n=1 Tax=Priestia koreensis TaxID=284581 RepID=UPI001F59DF58|nr:energy-coupling factor transporter transmembrane component T [Priestia koreensis]MCM3005967.1 energy-coupling factor transporter transmembrane protein EcfT [Priestia koreensis]UNL85308.1 energy-coupling factor transporter transmembrane protein EcfT [Priestia koreensis]